jgi:2-(1,2-epoxy-1,2-dihydrophenyl)acetyl-CoA isomerase
MNTIGDAAAGAGVEPVLLSTTGTVAVLRLNRPESRNAIDDELREALIVALGDVVRDPEIRAVVLMGSGTAFCAGGDVAAMRERLSAPLAEVAEAGWRRQRLTHRMVLDLHRLEKIVVAAVNGPAIGVGMDLALACDFIVASEAARFAMAHLTRGLVPDGGGMYFLPRRVGLARAKELVLTGRRLRADEAQELGIVDRVVTADELEQSAVDWAAELTQNSPIATALTKSILDRTFQLEAEGVLALGAEAQALCYTTDAHRTSVEGFLER